MGAVEAAGLSPAPGAGQGQPVHPQGISDNPAGWLFLGRWSSAVSNRGLFTRLQPTRHKATSKEEKKKKRAFPPLLEDEGISALIPKQTHLMPLNTPWHY